MSAQTTTRDFNERARVRGRLTLHKEMEYDRPDVLDYVWFDGTVETPQGIVDVYAHTSGSGRALFRIVIDGRLLTREEYRHHSQKSLAFAAARFAREVADAR